MMCLNLTPAPDFCHAHFMTRFPLIIQPKLLSFVAMNPPSNKPPTAPSTTPWTWPWT